MRPKEIQLLLSFHAFRNHSQLKASSLPIMAVTIVVSSGVVVICRMKDWSILMASMENFRR